MCIIIMFTKNFYFFYLPGILWTFFYLITCGYIWLLKIILSFFISVHLLYGMQISFYFKLEINDSICSIKLQKYGFILNFKFQLIPYFPKMSSMLFSNGAFHLVFIYIISPL